MWDVSPAIDNFFREYSDFLKKKENASLVQVSPYLHENNRDKVSSYKSIHITYKYKYQYVQWRWSVIYELLYVINRKS